MMDGKVLLALGILTALLLGLGAPLPLPVSAMFALAAPLALALNPSAGRPALAVCRAAAPARPRSAGVSRRG
jgi:hypothetical protein